MSPDLLCEYLAAARPSHEQALRQLHETIVDIVPEAELVLRRGVPAYRYRGRTLVSIGNARLHVSLYIMQGAVLADHADTLRTFDASRTVVRFDPGQIPIDLVTKLVRARRAEVEKISN